MRSPNYTTQCERDLRLLQRRGKNIEKLNQVLVALVNEEPLAERYRDHLLKGNYRNRRECHLEPDGLLIYKLYNDEIIFERTGSHSDLFEEVAGGGWRPRFVIMSGESRCGLRESVARRSEFMPRSVPPKTIDNNLTWM